MTGNDFYHFVMGSILGSSLHCRSYKNKIDTETNLIDVDNRFYLTHVCIHSLLLTQRSYIVCDSSLVVDCAS